MRGWGQITQKSRDQLPQRALKICRETLSKFLNRRRLLDFDIAFIWTSDMDTDTFYCHGVMQSKAEGARENLKKTHDRGNYGVACWQPCRLSWMKNCTCPAIYVSNCDCCNLHRLLLLSSLKWQWWSFLSIDTLGQGATVKTIRAIWTFVTLEWPLKVIQGQIFGEFWKSDIDFPIVYHITMPISHRLASVCSTKHRVGPLSPSLLENG